MEIARDQDDRELEVIALSVLGGAEVSTGHRDAGMVLLEEAMAAASSGQVRNVHTLGTAYCNLMVACTNAGEWDRAREWCELVDDFARSHEAAPLLGACRTIHADMLMATGRWPEAERALESALATHARYIPEMGAPTVATLAELRVRQGRIAEAERLLAGREEHPLSLRALALLRLAEGHPTTAAALVERGLRAIEDDALQAMALLAVLVDARLAAGQVDAARSAAEDLARIATETGIRLVRARADLAAARVAVAGPEPWSAAEPASRALAGFSALAMPLDAGAARMELARALANESPELAADELRAAYATFRALGAVRAMDAAAAAAARARRRRGWPAAAGHRADGPGAGGARADRARDVQRPDRPHPGDQREDGWPSRQPHSHQARRAQPRRGGRVRRTPGLVPHAKPACRRQAGTPARSTHPHRYPGSTCRRRCLVPRRTPRRGRCGRRSPGRRSSGRSRS